MLRIASRKASFSPEFAFNTRIRVTMIIVRYYRMSHRVCWRFNEQIFINCNNFVDDGEKTNYTFLKGIENGSIIFLLFLFG